MTQPFSVTHDPHARAGLRAALSALLCSLLACGPKQAGDDTSGEGETAATTTGGSVGTASAETATPTDPGMTDSGATTTPDPTTDPSGTTTDPETTTGGACSEFEDVVPGPGVKISLHNDGSDAVFLFHASSCAQVPLIEVFSSDSDAPTRWFHDVCEITCGQAIQGACACPPFCPADAILMIAPGGTHTFPWDGAALRDVPLPLECGADCGDSCLKVEQEEAGSYMLVARASTSAIVCADPDVCTCEPNAEGWCDVQASGIGAELRLAEGVLDYPGAQEITLTFTD
jgi:hypothetical protein